MVILFKCSTPEINQSNVWVPQNPAHFDPWFALVGRHPEITIGQENVFRLEVCVDQSKSMEKCHTGQELSSKLLDLVGWEGAEGVVLEPVVDRLSQQLKYHAHMVLVVEPLSQVQAFESVLWIIGLHGRQHSDLGLACIPVLLHCSNDLDCTVLPRLSIKTLDYFSKRALSQEPQDFVSRDQILVGNHNVVALFVIPWCRGRLASCA